MAPVVPTRRNVVTPSWASSSMAIEADGPPMPVEVTSTGTPPARASQVRYSRLLASSRASMRGAVRAMPSTRPGSPGKSATVAPSSIEVVKARW